MATVISKNARKFARQKGVSNKEISEILGWDEKQVKVFFEKDVFIDAKQLKLLSEFLGVKSSDLLAR